MGPEGMILGDLPLPEMKLIHSFIYSFCKDSLCQAIWWLVGKQNLHDVCGEKKDTENKNNSWVFWLCVSPVPSALRVSLNPLEPHERAGMICTGQVRTQTWGD